jgi:hypothetical protein
MAYHEASLMVPTDITAWFQLNRAHNGRNKATKCRWRSGVEAEHMDAGSTLREHVSIRVDRSRSILARSNLDAYLGIKWYAWKKPRPQSVQGCCETNVTSSAKLCRVMHDMHS